MIYRDFNIKVIIISSTLGLMLWIMANTPSLYAQPANDLPCNATQLTPAGSCSFTLFSNTDAGDSGLPNPGCGEYEGGDIWFVVTVPSSGGFNIQTDTEAEDQFPDNNGWMYRAAIALYEDSCESLTLMGCFENNSIYHPRMPGATVTGRVPGEKIWIRIWENSNNDLGKINICVTDQCPSTYDVTGGGSFCQGDTGVSVSLSGSDPGVSYILALNDTISLDTIQGEGNPLVWSQVTGAGIYRIRSIDEGAGCSTWMNDSAGIMILPVPSMTFNATSITCFEDDDGTVLTTVSSGTQPYLYEWTGDGGFISTQKDLANLPPGEYMLSVTDSNFCITTGNTILITEPELLKATIEDISHLSSYESNDGNIDLTVTGGTIPYYFSWHGTDNYQSAKKNPDEMTVGYYNLLVTDDHQCGDSIFNIKVAVADDPDQLFVPEGFSPNGDGYNDYFEILGLEAFSYNELIIFNRQGVKIFQRENYRNDWGGRSESGAVFGGMLPEGTYYYLLKYGDTGIRKGFIYVNRE